MIADTANDAVSNPSRECLTSELLSIWFWNTRHMCLFDQLGVLD